MVYLAGLEGLRFSTVPVRGSSKMLLFLRPQATVGVLIKVICKYMILTRVFIVFQNSLQCIERSPLT